MGYSDSKSTKNSGGILISGFLNRFVKLEGGEKYQFDKNGTDFVFLISYFIIPL